MTCSRTSEQVERVFDAVCKALEPVLKAFTTAVKSTKTKKNKAAGSIS